MAVTPIPLVGFYCLIKLVYSVAMCYKMNLRVCIELVVNMCHAGFHCIYACVLYHRSFVLVRLVPSDNHTLKTPIFKLLI